MEFNICKCCVVVEEVGYFEVLFYMLIWCVIVLFLFGGWMGLMLWGLRGWRYLIMFLWRFGWGIVLGFGLVGWWYSVGVVGWLLGCFGVMVFFIGVKWYGFKGCGLGYVMWLWLLFCFVELVFRV